MTYRLIRSTRRTVAIQIKADGEVVVRAPARMSSAAIEQFVSARRDWIEKHLPKQRDTLPQFTEEELQVLRQQAKMVIPDRVAHYASQIGVTYGSVTIRSQRTRWGSCSSNENLSFNCLLMLAPASVQDYVVVHELCHRKQMNHASGFWEEVARILPDYQERRHWLKENGYRLIGRLG